MFQLAVIELAVGLQQHDNGQQLSNAPAVCTSLVDFDPHGRLHVALYRKTGVLRLPLLCHGRQQHLMTFT